MKSYLKTHTFSYQNVFYVKTLFTPKSFFTPKLFQAKKVNFLPKKFFINMATPYGNTFLCNTFLRKHYLTPKLFSKKMRNKFVQKTNLAKNVFQQKEKSKRRFECLFKFLFKFFVNFVKNVALIKKYMIWWSLKGHVKITCLYSNW